MILSSLKYLMASSRVAVPSFATALRKQHLSAYHSVRRTHTAEQTHDERFATVLRENETVRTVAIHENLWEGSFYPRLPDGKRKKFNVYAKTREACEKKLAKLIAKKKAEIKKAKQKG